MTSISGVRSLLDVAGGEGFISSFSCQVEGRFFELGTVAKGPPSEWTSFALASSIEKDNRFRCRFRLVGEAVGEDNVDGIESVAGAEKDTFDSSALKSGNLLFRGRTEPCVAGI